MKYTQFSLMLLVALSSVANSYSFLFLNDGTKSVNIIDITKKSWVINQDQEVEIDVEISKEGFLVVLVESDTTNQFDITYFLQEKSGNNSQKLLYSELELFSSDETKQLNRSIGFNVDKMSNFDQTSIMPNDFDLDSLEDLSPELNDALQNMIDQLSQE